MDSQLPGLLAGLNYPANRPPYFATKYQRMLLKTCSIMEIRLDGFALCSLVALTEDSKRYTRAPRFWRKHLCEYLSVSKTTVYKVIERCQKAGLLHYEPGRSGRPCVMWCDWPACWGKIIDGHLDDDDQPVQAAFSDQTLVRIADQSRTNRGPIADTFLPIPVTSTTTKAVVVDFEELENKLLACGVVTARETIHKSLSNGATPEFIRSVIEYYSGRPGAWGPGALVRRLTFGRVQSFPLAEGWPIPSQKESELRRKNTVAIDRETSLAEAQTSAARKAKDRQLEMQFGPILDALPLDQVLYLVTAKKPTLLPQLQRKGYGSDSPLVRLGVLGLLAAEPAK